MVTSTRARFGQYVYHRRRLLNLTQDEVTAAGGPSDAAQTRAENGTGPDPSIETLRKLDLALRWAPGSAARTLEGGEPVPLESSESRRIPAERPPLRLGPSQIPLDLETLVELLAPHGAVNRIAEEHPGVPGLSDAAAELDRVVSKITGAYVTRLLEVNGGPSGPRQPLLEFAFGHLLEAPPSTADPVEREEALYRRYLYGRGHDLDAATRERYRRRWESATDHVGAASNGPAA
ncbi:helix-turn-helix transcriptional regulator [Rhodococcus triatomae]|uniref:Helix-turn-helix domain-containing protein n=1 Tax=Rhodococcus triatomae TaxID=300028 RepID=A0A1G8PQQ1_9NOCA|nr:helix-turn-helix domain-containing protein [Rhodococcus triatomae]QNG20173.1 helix-turn-helix transcriptional regulator [Rhodococcus triatomae]QNG23911.1 helix-turn-helix transcriptional regulator [Rhodococcus triatomae]SDI94869.1 Helix-turn-helix domain-containing protein [Rhodococcus triatomae]